MEKIDLNHPITEDDIVNFLVTSPDFFARHADVLSAVQITSPHGNRAVSLQERQAEMLREKIKGLEQRIVEMVRNAHENAVVADKLEQWACQLLRTDEPAELPALICADLAARFDVPQVALKLWNVDAPFADAPFTQGAGDDAKIFASSLTAPFCGANPGFEVADWLGDPESAVSLALIPLRWQTRSEIAAAAQAGAAAAPAAGDLTDADAAIAQKAGGSESGVDANDFARERIEPTLSRAREEPPLESGERPTEPACGLLVLGSSDPRRFQSGMGTDFLERLADLAGAALSRLRPDGGNPA